MLNLHQCSSRKIKKSNDQTSLDFSLVALIFLLIPNASFSQPVIQATDPSQQLTPNTVKSPASVSHYKSPASSIDAAQLTQESIPSFALSSWVERAISQHPSVLQALAQEQALTQELESARWQYWPNVTVSADATKDGPGSTIGAEIPLWTAGRLGAQTDQARANLAAQTNAIQVARYSIAEQVVDAWALAAQSAGRVRVLDETLKTLSRYEAIMERRVSTEISPRVELDLLRARVGETQINRTNADNQGQIAVRRLKLLSDQYIAWDEWKKTSLLDQADALSRPNETSDETQHPAVQQATQEVQAAEAEKRIFQAAQWPEVFAGAQTTVGRELLQDVPNAYIALRYETGNGLSKSSLANAAGARAQAALLAVGNVRLEIAERLQIHRLNWQNSVERLQYLAKAQSASNSVVASYERQYIAGKRTWQDVLNSVRENGDNAIGISDSKAQMIGSWWHVQILTSSFSWQNPIPDQATP